MVVESNFLNLSIDNSSNSLNSGFGDNLNNNSIRNIPSTINTDEGSLVDTDFNISNNNFSDRGSSSSNTTFNTTDINNNTSTLGTSNNALFRELLSGGNQFGSSNFGTTNTSFNQLNNRGFSVGSFRGSSSLSGFTFPNSDINLVSDLGFNTNTSSENFAFTDFVNSDDGRFTNSPNNGTNSIDNPINANDSISPATNNLIFSDFIDNVFGTNFDAGYSGDSIQSINGNLDTNFGTDFVNGGSPNSDFATGDIPNANDENIRLTGSSNNDRLNGGQRGDTLIGLRGNDVLVGHRGNDALELVFKEILSR